MTSPANQELLEKFEEFYRTYYREDVGGVAREYPEERSLYVDWSDLYQYDTDLADNYLSRPEQMRKYAEEALQMYDLPVDVTLGQAHVRVYNLPENTKIRELRSRHIKRLVSIQGIVRKRTEVYPKIIEAAFECKRCGTLTRIPQSGGNLREPHECQGCERQGPFRINHDQSEFIDSQQLRIQETPDSRRADQTPASIDINLEDDLTAKVNPGDHVTVTGVLHVEQQGNQRNKSTIFETDMDAVSVVKEDDGINEAAIDKEDEERIEALADSGDLFDKIVASIAPGVFGHQNEKRAIALQLASGTAKILPDDTRIRGTIHLLFIGDPGAPKRDLLEYVRRIAPWAIHTSAKTTSEAGLIAAAVRDDFGDAQKWSLEAGTVVLADQGVAIVDDLEKLDSDTRSALELPLEKSLVSISKATIDEILPARCSLLSAASPKYGRFDSCEPIAEQIGLEPGIIS